MELLRICCLLCIATSLSLLTETAGQFIRVCYFSTWFLDKLKVEDVDPYLCTHLIYAQAIIDGYTEKMAAETADEEEGEDGRFKKFTKLKETNPHLKTMLSLECSDMYAQSIIASEQKLSDFVASAILFLRDRQFDGLNIAWEYEAPSKEDLSKFLKGLRDAINKEKADPESRLVLSLNGPRLKTSIDEGYNVSDVAKYVDFVNLETFDYAERFSEKTVFNSPLFSRESSADYNHQHSTKSTVVYWKSGGLPVEKTVIGVTGEGYRFALTDVSTKEPGSEARTELPDGVEAKMTYPEICEWLRKSNTTRYFDDEQRSPYFVNKDTWVGYEDTESLQAKITWCIEMKLLGIAFFTMDQDDVTGTACHKGKFPLLNYIKNKTRLVEGRDESTGTPDTDSPEAEGKGKKKPKGKSQADPKKKPPSTSSAYMTPAGRLAYAVVFASTLAYYWRCH